MKTFTTYLVGLALVGGMTGTGYAQLAPQAPKAKVASLAAQLPADTLFYFEVPDISGLREGIGSSSLGKIYGDPEMQAFLAESLGMLDKSWEQIRGMSGGMGIPEELTYWDALVSMEGGLAFRADPSVEDPFSSTPQVYATFRIGLKEGLGQPVFNLLTTALESEGVELVGSENGEILVTDFGEGSVEIFLDGDALVATLLIGAKGEGSLASTQKFMDARSQTFSDGSVVFGYFQWNTALEAMLRGVSFKAPMFHGPASRLYERALKPIDSLSFASGWTEQGSFTNLRLGMSGEGEGLFSVEKADLDLLKYVPSDASSFYVKSEATQVGAFIMETIDDFGSVDMGGMVLRDGLAEEAPEVYSWIFGDKRPELDAAIAGLGSRSFGYGTSVGMQSENLMFTQLKDGAAVSNMLTQLMPRMRELLDEQGSPIRLNMKRVALRVKKDDGSIENVKGPAYYMIDFAFMDEMPPQLSALTGSFQPTFGVTEDGWLVFSMSKQPVRRILMNGIEVPEENITSNPDVEGFLAGLKPGVSAIAWSDPRPAVDAAAGMAIGMMPMLLGMAAGEMDLPFEADKLPSAELFSRYLSPTESVSWTTKTECISRTVGSFGLADMFTVAGAVTAIGPPAAMFFMMDSGGGMQQVAPPSPAEEEEF
ncbi:MAG: hypothetical protein QM477_04210 [Planctomycetota bacterium]